MYWCLSACVVPAVLLDGPLCRVGVLEGQSVVVFEGESWCRMAALVEGLWVLLFGFVVMFGARHRQGSWV